ncbi:MAG: leucine-rich repeat domain-containing protein, partial [Oscillospiraceae bacterium]|nr:leucine-rich repeat domain-containing protein [Oscillospiraceae bacterium]
SDGVTTVGKSAFTNFSYMTAATLGKDVTYIGSYGFSGCSRLSYLKYPGDPPRIAEYGLRDCKHLVSAAFPESTTEIQPGTFCGSGLRGIEIPNTVTTIGKEAFGDCSSLTMLVLPPSVSNAQGLFYRDDLHSLMGIEKMVVLNPQCDFGYELGITCRTDRVVTVYGYEDSTAQLRALEGGHAFKKLCDCKDFGEGCHIETKAPTCTEVGQALYTCDTCKVELVIQTERILGHCDLYINVGTGHTLHCVDCGEERWQHHHYIADNGACFCGFENPPIDHTLQINHSLDLASDITINYIVPAELLQDYDMDTVYLDVFHLDHGYQYLARISPVLRDGYYYFPLQGLTAVQMTLELQAYLSGMKNGQLYMSWYDHYSVATYAYNQLPVLQGKTTGSHKLKTLCADLLRYGAAAQRYKGHYREAFPLADTYMNDEARAYLSDLSRLTYGNTNRELEDLAEPQITWLGKSLELNTRVTLKYIFDARSYTGKTEDLTMKVTYLDIHGQEQTHVVSDPVPYGAAGFYSFSFDGLLAAELRAVVSAQIFDGETPLSRTLQYSADTYCGGKTGLLGDLCAALMAYSDSAKAYFQ